MDKIEEDIGDCPIANVTVDTDGRITSVSEEFSASFGWTERDLMGRPIEDLVPSRLRAHHERVRKAFQQAPMTRFMGEFRSRVRLRKHCGKIVPVRVALWQRKGHEGTLAFAIPIYEPGAFWSSSALWACILCLATGCTLKLTMSALDAEATFMAAGGITGLMAWTRDRMKLEGISGE